MSNTGERRWVRLAVVLWAVILVAGFARALVAPPSKANLTIYAKCTEAARNWLAGEPVYPPAWSWEMFPYSPAVAAGFAPLAALPDRVGVCLWRLGIGAAFLAALSAWMTACLPGPLSAGRKAVLFLLVIPLTAPTVLVGQAGGLVAAAVLAGIAAAARGRWNWCAAFVAAACLLKAYPVAVALLLAACYPRQLGLRLAAFVGLGLALPFALQRPGYVLAQYEGWLHLLATCDRLDWRPEMANRNLSLLFRVWLVPLSPGVHTAVQLVAAAGAAAACVAARRRGWPDRDVLLAVLGLGGCWMTLFGPAVEHYTYILVGPTLAGLLAAAGGRPAAYRALLVGSWAIFAACAAAVWVVRTTPLYNLGPHPVAGLLLLAALIWDLGRRFAGPRPAGGSGRGVGIPLPGVGVRSQ